MVRQPVRIGCSIYAAEIPARLGRFTCDFTDHFRGIPRVAVRILPGVERAVTVPLNAGIREPVQIRAEKPQDHAGVCGSTLAYPQNMVPGERSRRKRLKKRFPDEPRIRVLQSFQIIDGIRHGLVGIPGKAIHPIGSIDDCQRLRARDSSYQKLRRAYSAGHPGPPVSSRYRKQSTT